MGIFGFGDDEKQAPGTALEQANTQPRGASAMVYKVLQPILDVGIEGRGRSRRRSTSPTRRG